MIQHLESTLHKLILNNRGNKFLSVYELSNCFNFISFLLTLVYSEQSLYIVNSGRIKVFKKKQKSFKKNILKSISRN